MTRPWVPHAVEFHSDLDRPELAVSPWGGHRWFAYDLTRWARPRRIVELGTHYGCSYFAFCQALVDEDSDAEVVAIDTWEGEEHSGRYGEEVFETFTDILERRYPAVNSRLIRSTFDEALAQVDDGSVDLLHIDGLHTYEAVRHDYETWKDKLSPNGIVLFHDVAPSSGYGSSRYWQEVRAGLPSFAFLHSFGLGVLLPNGTDGRDALLELGQGPWRSYYQHRAGHALRDRQVIDLTAMVEARDEALAATTMLVDERDAALRTVSAELDQVRDALESTHRQLDAVAASMAEKERATAATFQRRLAEADRAHQAVAAANDELELRLAAAEQRQGELHHEMLSVIEARDAYAANLELYRRALRPVRWASQPPRRVLRRLRHRDLPAIGPGARRTADQPGGDPIEADRRRADGPALFDPSWYEARYPDVQRAGADPLDHWLTYGWKEGRHPCPLFDAGAYLQAYPDVAEAELDPLTHWAGWGWREDRDPSPLFSTAYYRTMASQSDALEGYDEHRLGPDDEPLGHYLEHGLKVGLFVSPGHAESVLRIPDADRTEDEVLSNIVMADEAGASRSVPLSWLTEVDADLVTFDLWDTLLTRTRPADAAKLATARRLRMTLGLGPGTEPTTWQLMAQRTEIEAAIAGPDNGEYLIDDVLTRQLESLVDAERVDVPALAGALRRAELEDEMAGTRPLHEVVVLLDKLAGRGTTRVAVLSDFYMCGEDLRELLAHHGISGGALEVVSSADVGRSKHAGGSLFLWAREQYGVAEGRHVHIGDNPHADVAMQVETGGTAVHLVHGTRRLVGPGQLDETTMRTTLDAFRSDLAEAAELRCRQGGLSPQPESRVVHAAWRTALLPVALVAAAVEEATSRGLDRVHYCSREGQFLARIHDEVASILRPEQPLRAIHLAVSRRSTFGPSLPDLSPDSLMGLWRMYPHQSTRALLVSLGVDADGYADAAGKQGLDLDAVIEGIHLDQRVAAFLGDGRVQQRLQDALGERRAALLSYLEGQTDVGSGEMVLVDVGWRGTMQDNLARLLPRTRLVGWYLALFPYLNPQPDNGEKHAIGPDGNVGDEVDFMEPPAAVERPWTPPVPSVVDYRTGPDGVVPVLDEEVLHTAGRTAIARYQDAVAEAAPMVARWIVANGAATDVLRPIVVDELTRYYTEPEPGIADLWFDNAHDDTFGVLNVTSFGKDRPGRDWFADGVGLGFLQHLEQAASASLWPAGYRSWRPVQAAVAIEQALRSGRFRNRP